MKYRLVSYIRVEPDPEEEELFDSYEDAKAEMEQAVCMQPENVYQIEPVYPKMGMSSTTKKEEAMSVVLIMEGGLIQKVLTDSPAVDICVLDVDYPDPEDSSYIVLDLDGEPQEFIAQIVAPDEVDSAKVDRIFADVIEKLDN